MRYLDDTIIVCSQFTINQCFPIRGLRACPAQNGLFGSLGWDVRNTLTSRFDFQSLKRLEKWCLQLVNCARIKQLYFPFPYFSFRPFSNVGPVRLPHSYPYLYRLSLFRKHLDRQNILPRMLLIPLLLFFE